MSKIRYRPDIDGLRAVAVLAVIMFHGNLGMSGGFVGVDVFFVISGFLITSIILREVSEGRFSFWNFYKRRALRILPALFAMISGCFIVGWFILPPSDYENLADSAIASIAFYPNFFFYENSNYFAPEAITKPLLHVWSLGVEEQFYFLAPSLLLLATKFPRWRIPAFITLFLSSLAFSVYILSEDSHFAFFMLPSRAFEFMIGVGLALGLLPKMRGNVAAEAVAFAGLTMIIVACLAYDDSTTFPGFQALLPCAGAALVIHAGAGAATWTSRLLSLSPIVFVGKISYSLYLWHWPVLVFVTYEYGPELDIQTRLMSMGAAGLAATLSYYLVEQPVRIRGAALRPAAVVVASAVTMLIWLVPIQAVRELDGIPSRLPPAAAAFAATTPLSMDMTGVCLEPASRMDCRVGTSSVEPQFLLFGDSHAAAISGEVARIAVANEVAGRILFRGGCPPLLGLNKLETNRFRKCFALAEKLDEVLASSSIKTVIWHARWANCGSGIAMKREADPPCRLVEDDLAAHRRLFEEMATETARKLSADGRRVIIVGPVPELGFNLPAEMIRALMQGRSSSIRLPRHKFEERQSGMLELLARLDAMEGVKVVYPHELMCDTTTCRTEIDGRALYVDDDHLSPTGAAFIAPLFADALRNDRAPLRSGLAAPASP